MNCLIREADMIVSMGGYNTLCEVVSNGKPAVVIPPKGPKSGFWGGMSAHSKEWAVRSKERTIRSLE